MHDNKIHAPVTTWPHQQYLKGTAILMRPCILKHTSQGFSSKKNLPNSNLNKSLIAGNHVYLNCSAFLGSNQLRSARYETPLLLDVKIEKLKI